MASASTRWLGGIGAGLLALILTLGGCGGAAKSTEEARGGPSPEAEQEPVPLEERLPGETLEFTALKFWRGWEEAPEDERTFSMQEVRGQVVIVHFWASWCEPCRKSMPYYDRLLKKYNTEHGAEVLEVVAVNIDAEREVAVMFLEEVPVDFITVWDEGAEIQRDLDVDKMPVTLLVDEQGVVRYAHVGEEEYQQVTLLEELDTLLD
ncbi:MAG: TlpA family protein disulfide reductase [Myxococcota bacterium]